MRLLLVLSAAMFPAIAAAAECTARSGPQVTPVVELYTSEGCSSCPPADRWFSTLAADAAAGRVVPVAFHVNYWDYIGWKDPFGSEAATRRQREVQAAVGARYVYTPQVVLGGRDFREWRGAALATSLEAIRRQPARATIDITVKADPARGIEVASRATAQPGARADGWVLLVAATQDGLSSRVTAGENRGERLAHDFVVRDFAVHRGLGEATSAFKPARGWNLARMSVAAFVQDARSGEVVQAVACRLG
jgi:hypothetical protein